MKVLQGSLFTIFIPAELLKNLRAPSSKVVNSTYLHTSSFPLHTIELSSSWSLQLFIFLRPFFKNLYWIRVTRTLRRIKWEFSNTWHMVLVFIFTGNLLTHAWSNWIFYNQYNKYLVVILQSGVNPVCLPLKSDHFSPLAHKQNLHASTRSHV